MHLKLGVSLLKFDLKMCASIKLQGTLSLAFCLKFNKNFMFRISMFQILLFKLKV